MMKSLYEKYHKELVGKVFVVTSTKGLLTTEYTFEDSPYKEYGVLSYYSHSGKYYESNEYDYQDIFKNIESGVWKIISYKHLMIERVKKNSIFAF
jgi:hypothetical protein